MMGKQIIVDIVVVFVVPLLLIGGYYFFRGDDSALLSLVSSGAMSPSAEDLQLGSKTEAALMLLNTIRLDDSLFTDPAYLSLKEYQVIIPTTPLGRPFPFTLPRSLLSGRSQSTARVESVRGTQSSSAAEKLDALQSVGAQ